MHKFQKIIAQCENGPKSDLKTSEKNFVIIMWVIIFPLYTFYLWLLFASIDPNQIQEKFFVRLNYLKKENSH